MRRDIDGRIAPRSGLASKHHIDTGAGVIDADYRGEVKVLLFNHGEKDFEGTFMSDLWRRKETQRRGMRMIWPGELGLINILVKEGDRVAQLVLERVCLP